jgi:hypothetical protein
VPLLGIFHCAKTCNFITTLPVAFSFAAISFGRLHFNLDVNPILMHLAGLSRSMRHWVVCRNLPCSKTCCWRSHKLRCWVHSMWIPVATSQKMVSTAVVPVRLSGFNMGLHCSAACCFTAHAWRTFLQFAICYPVALQLNATRVDWVDLRCHHSSSMGLILLQCRWLQLERHCSNGLPIPVQ